MQRRTRPIVVSSASLQESPTCVATFDGHSRARGGEADGRREEQSSFVKNMASFGLYGLAVMGQNFALNIAEHGFQISVCNRSASKVDECVARAKCELGANASNLKGYHDPKEFVASLSKPRTVMFLVQAGAPVDQSIALFRDILEPGDMLIDGGNE